MNRLQAIPFALLLAASAGTQAATFSYDYLEGGFGEVDIEEYADVEGDIIQFGGAMSLNKQFGFVGGLGIVDYDGTDGNTLRGGGLFHTELNKDLDLFGTVELVYSTWDAASGDDDDVGLAASAGLRYAMQDNFHLEGKLTVVEVDPFDDGLGLMAGARYYIGSQLSAAAGFASDAEYDGIWVNIRYNLK